MFAPTEDDVKKIDEYFDNQRSPPDPIRENTGPVVNPTVNINADKLMNESNGGNSINDKASGGNDIMAINVGGFGLDASQNVMSDVSKIGAPYIVGAYKGASSIFGKRYYAGPDDKIGFRDSMHAQDFYNTFAGGVGALNDMTTEIGSGYYKWTTNTSKDIASGDIENGFWGGFAAKERRDALQFLDKNIAAPVATIGDFSARFLNYINPMVAIPMAIGTAGMVVSGAVLVQEGLNQPYRPNFALFLQRHVFGVNIPYGEQKITRGPLETVVEEIPAGTTKKFDAGATINDDGKQIIIKPGDSYTFKQDAKLTTQSQNVTTEQNIYHVPGIGEQAMGLIENPAGLAAAVTYLGTGTGGLIGPRSPQRVVLVRERQAEDAHQFLARPLLDRGAVGL
jgi:hypothetical protein